MVSETATAVLFSFCVVLLKGPLAVVSGTSENTSDLVRIVVEDCFAGNVVEGVDGVVASVAGVVSVTRDVFFDKVCEIDDDFLF